MSEPTVPFIDIEREQVIILLLESIALEEIALAHILNAEAEKMQLVVGTLSGITPWLGPPTARELIELNEDIDSLIHVIIKKEMLLLLKLEDILSIIIEDGID